MATILTGAGSVSGSPYVFTVSLLSQGSGELVTAPTLVRADVRISTDGGALVQLTDTPQEVPAGSGVVEVSLTADEVGSERFAIVFDDAIGNEWQQLTYHESVKSPCDCCTSGGSEPSAIQPRAF